MKSLAYLYSIEAIILWCLVSMGLFNKNNEIYSAILIIITSGEFFYFLYKSNRQKEDFKFLLFFVLAYMVRMICIYYDIYVETIDPGDCHDFRIGAENYFYTNIAEYRGMTSMTVWFMGIICKIFGPQRVILQYVGAMCFLIACHLTNEILKKMNFSKKVRYFCMIWMMFTPQNIKNTSISNREGFIIFFVALSIYFFVLWWERNKIHLLVGAIVFLLCSMILHAGTVGVLLGYVFMFSFYNRKTEKIEIKWNTVLILTISFVVFLFFFQTYRDTFFRKFASMDSISDISQVAGYGNVRGATYVIPGENAKSLGAIIYYTPLRIFYYLLSPVPWYWRGIVDVGAFIVCSIPHILIVVIFIKELFLRTDKEDRKRKSLMICLFLSAVAIAVIFAWGTKNGGTAIRHRDKFLCLYTILFAEAIERWLIKGKVKGEQQNDTDLTCDKRIG